MAFPSVVVEPDEAHSKEAGRHFQFRSKVVFLGSATDRVVEDQNLLFVVVGGCSRDEFQIVRNALNLDALRSAAAEVDDPVPGDCEALSGLYPDVFGLGWHLAAENVVLDIKVADPGGVVDERSIGFDADRGNSRGGKLNVGNLIAADSEHGADASVPRRHKNARMPLILQNVVDDDWASCGAVLDRQFDSFQAV